VLLPSGFVRGLVRVPYTWRVEDRPDQLRSLLRVADGSPPGTPSLLRAMNARTLLDRLRRDGPTTRAQLARETGLSKPTVSMALANLERAGLVRAVGRESPQRGRAGLLYELDASAAFVMGIDIGRAWIRVAVADLSGRIVARRDERNRARSAQAVVRTVSDLAHDVASTGDLSWSQVVHTVVGSPGIFDPASGRLRLAPNLPGWSRRGLVDALRDELGSSLVIENDANLAALGERSYGRGADADAFVYVSVGTGVGMGIVIDGELYRGAHGVAGEIGFLPLPGANSSDPDARVRGLLEQAASADAVVRNARGLDMRGPLSAKRVFAAAREGDEQALAAVKQEAERLALVVATIAAILDPELVVLGGGVGHNTDLLRGPLESTLRGLTPLELSIVESALGQDAIVLGAIATALDTAHELVFEQRVGGRATPG
jgi:predicted NBD/HSP70 family sugar kinase